MAIEKSQGYASGDAFASEVRATLKRSGIDLKAEAALVFYLYVPSNAAAKACAAQLRTAEVESEIEKAASGALKWLCLGKRKLIPEKKALTQIGALLVELAHAHKGQFDGWEMERKMEAFDFAALLAQLAKK
jgi:hypothetical protein